MLVIACSIYLTEHSLKGFAVVVDTHLYVTWGYDKSDIAVLGRFSAQVIYCLHPTTKCFAGVMKEISKNIFRLRALIVIIFG